MTLTGDWRRLADTLGRLAKLSTEDLGRQIGEALLRSTKERFRMGRGPDGERWEPSARVRQKGGQTLVNTRRLERSLGYQVRTGAVEVGTNDKRADVHQQGKTIRARRKRALKFKVGKQWVMVKQVKMPARPFIGISDEDDETIQQIIDEEIGGRLR